MEQVKFINHNGTRILRIEFPDGAEKHTILEIIAEIKKNVESQPKNSVFTLTTIGSFTYDTEITRAFDDYIKFNKPYVKAGAVVGITGLKKALYNSLMLLSKRKVRVCNTEEEAINYLVGENGSLEAVD
jgi:hypothetical protein